jgi:dihydroxyacetone kinase-like protein
MAVSGLSIEQMKQMFLHLCRDMVSSTNLLSQADRAIGDGDHGVGMARGFEAVRERLEGETYQTAADLLKSVGTVLIASIGGASGAIFGTFFRGAAESLAERRQFTATDFAALLAGGLAAVKARGGAKAGDKTMVDALEPAALKAAAMTGEPLSQIARASAEAAREGMEKTKGMIARVGKAKTLGERSLGHLDPGAVSVHLMLRSMADYIAGYC